jgi:hypothetical protein
MFLIFCVGQGSMFFLTSDLGVRHGDPESSTNWDELPDRENLSSHRGSLGGRTRQHCP